MVVNAVASLIDQEDVAVLSALTQSDSAGKQVNGDSDLDHTKSREPVAFFYTIFGITFEALTARSSEIGQGTRSPTVALVAALHKVLVPSVAGTAMYARSTFDETLDLLRRLIFTEGPRVQKLVVGILRNMCTAHPLARSNLESEQQSEAVSEQIDQLFDLTRTIVLTLKGIIPSLNGSQLRVRSPAIDAEVVSLVAFCIDALVDAAEVFPVMIRADLHASIIHIFTTLMATGSYQDELVPALIPRFRRFCRVMQSQRQETASSPTEGSGIQIRDCLRRLLQLFLYGQRRDTSYALPLVKNMLLALTIILSECSASFQSASSTIESIDPLVTRSLDQIVDCLTDRMTAKVAAQCCRSMLFAPAPNDPKISFSSPQENGMIAYLLPHLLAFLLTTHEDPEHARNSTAQTLTAYIASIPAAAPLMLVFVPSLLHRSEREKPAEAARAVLELATRRPGEFRQLVLRLPAERREVLQELLRVHAGVGGKAEVDVEDEKPAIALKMDF